MCSLEHARWCCFLQFPNAVRLKREGGRCTRISPMALEARLRPSAWMRTTPVPAWESDREKYYYTNDLTFWFNQEIGGDERCSSADHANQVLDRGPEAVAVHLARRGVCCESLCRWGCARDRVKGCLAAWQKQQWRLGFEEEGYVVIEYPVQ